MDCSFLRVFSANASWGSTTIVSINRSRNAIIFQYVLNISAVKPRKILEFSLILFVKETF